MKSYKTAFSTFEIAIVLLLVALIVAATIQVNNLSTKGRLASARSLTETSVVNSMEGLVAWFETSLPSSFGNLDWQDGDSISVWYDRSRENLVRNNATQTSSTNQPKIYSNVFNKVIPGLRFDGSTSYMNYSGTGIVNSAYTIFMVEQRRNNGNDKYFLAGTVSGTNLNLVLGYRSNTVVTLAHHGNDMNVTIPAYTSPIPNIHVFAFNGTSGKSYYNYSSANTPTNPITGSSAQLGAITAYSGAQIGRFLTAFYYNGDIAEIIIFKRKLTTTEQQAVLLYLSKKYDVPLS